MKLGLVSDSHNQQGRLQQAAQHFRAAQVRTVLHAGDITKPAMLPLLAEFDVWLAQGNMDRDARLAPTIQQHFGAGHWRPWHTLTFQAAHIALLHGDQWKKLEACILEGTYDYVIHGHTHQPRDERIGNTRVINPGALYHSRGSGPSCAILNVATADLTWFWL